MERLYSLLHLLRVKEECNYIPYYQFLQIKYYLIEENTSFIALMNDDPRAYLEDLLELVPNIRRMPYVSSNLSTGICRSNSGSRLSLLNASNTSLQQRNSDPIKIASVFTVSKEAVIRHLCSGLTEITPACFTATDFKCFLGANYGFSYYADVNVDISNIINKGIQILQVTNYNFIFKEYDQPRFREFNARTTWLARLSMALSEGIANHVTDNSARELRYIPPPRQPTDRPLDDMFQELNTEPPVQARPIPETPTINNIGDYMDSIDWGSSSVTGSSVSSSDWMSSSVADAIIEVGDGILAQVNNNDVSSEPVSEDTNLMADAISEMGDIIVNRINTHDPIVAYVPSVSEDSAELISMAQAADRTVESVRGRQIPGGYIADEVGTPSTNVYNEVLSAISFTTPPIPIDVNRTWLHNDAGTELVYIRGAFSIYFTNAPVSLLDHLQYLESLIRTVDNRYDIGNATVFNITQFDTSRPGNPMLVFTLMRLNIGDSVTGEVLQYDGMLSFLAQVPIRFVIVDPRFAYGIPMPVVRFIAPPEETEVTQSAIREAVRADDQRLRATSLGTYAANGALAENQELDTEQSTIINMPGVVLNGDYLHIAAPVEEPMITTTDAFNEFFNT